MKIELFPPLALHEKGRREGNEDCIYPPLSESEQAAASHLFLVCDGVGGMEKGEEASRLVCQIFSTCLNFQTLVREAEVASVLQNAELALDKYVEEHPDAEGMATTLTLLHFNERGATVAHIGDSRVYQLRGGQILFRTDDHSMVNEMVAQKIITPEEALSHPKKNVITRAIAGSRRPTRADVAFLQDIQAGDYFFMCTDGVLESVSDNDLSIIISNHDLSDQLKLDQIFTLCQQYSRDNFSAYLLHVKHVPTQGLLSIEMNSVTVPNTTTPFPIQQASASPPLHVATQTNGSKAAMILLLVVAGAAMLFLFFLVVGGSNLLSSTNSASMSDSTMQVQNLDSLPVSTDSLAVNPDSISSNFMPLQIQQDSAAFSSGAVKDSSQ